MGTPSRKARILEALFKDGSESPTTHRQTRAMTAVAGAAQRNGRKEELQMIRRSSASKNEAAHGDVRLEGKRKGKPVSAAVVDVVFGRQKVPIAQDEELIRKRAEDTVRCGRQVRVAENAPNEISKPSKRKYTEDNDLDCEKWASTPSGPPDVVEEIALPAISVDLGTRQDEEVAEDAELEDRDKDHVDTALIEDNRSVQVEQPLEAKSGLQNRMSPLLSTRGKQSGVDVETFNPYVERSQPQILDSRSPSPIFYFHDKISGTAHRARNISTAEDYGSQQKWCSDSMQRSLHEDASVRRSQQFCRSPRSSPSRSPMYQRRRGKFGNDVTCEDDDGNLVLGRRPPRDVENPDTHSFQQQLERRNKFSRYHGNEYRHRRSLSTEVSNKYWRRSGSSEKSESPYTPRNRSSEEAVVEFGSRNGNMRALDIAASSASVDRRERRYKVAIREGKGHEWRKGGKKPFYLTLNSEGKPYGPGKLAWIAEVNRLAAGLDPSCTHIRKQTHEAMCTVKDRLDDHFEYSGELNQDHLRALLGKAVTRRRTELIGMIKNNRVRLVTIDREVWLRLEKLASSRQRQNRTDIGRYANSCRQTLGRTGAAGEDRVRERLAEMYGRSPDPDEVAEEMERDKGYERKDMEGRSLVKRKLENKDTNVALENGNRHRSVHIALEEFDSEGTHGGRRAPVLDVALQGPPKYFSQCE